MENYLATDENGDVFIYNEKPIRRNIEGFWCSNGEEEKIYCSPLHCYTPIGRLMNIPEELIFSIKWEDEPIKITISYKKD